MVNVKPIEKGTRFWKLVTLWEVWHIWRYVAEKCLCDCWTVKWITRNHLRRWASKSCWCWMIESSRRTMIKMCTKHWMFWTRIYDIYRSIYGRCYNKNCPNFFRYWGRGIKCEWESFEDFYRDMWESYEAHVKEYWEMQTSIDRINNDGNYSKENCRRATKIEQWNNRRTNRLIEYEWKTYTITNLARKFNLPWWILNTRLRRWWDLEKALMTPKIIQRQEKKESDLSTNK